MTPRLQRMLLGLLTTATLLLVGALAGGLLSKIGATGMGWDRLARALGGMMIGGTVGGVAGIVLSMRLALPSLKRTAVVCVAIAVLSWGGLYLWAQSRNEPTIEEMQPTTPTSPGAKPTQPPPSAAPGA